MLNPYLKPYLLTACVVALTACGSDNSTHTSTPVLTDVPTTTSQPQTNTQQTNTQQNTPATPTQPKPTDTTPTTPITPTTPTTPAPQPSVTTPTPTPTTPAIPKPKPADVSPAQEQNFAKALEKGFEGMKRGTYTGVTITIDNTTKTVSSQANANQRFDDFSLNGAKVLLLERSNDRISYVPVRKLVQEDFKSGFAPKDVNNAGWIGSRFGSQSELTSFGELRYGVYTDSTNKTHLFVHGNPASRVFSGEYIGSAIIGKDGVYKDLPNSLKAIVSKDLSQLSIAINTQSDTLNFGGAIKGNTFEGTQNNIKTKGGFFGEGLGGVFEVTEGTHKDENGVFGAAKKTSELTEFFK